MYIKTDLLMSVTECHERLEEVVQKEAKYEQAVITYKEKREKQMEQLAKNPKQTLKKLHEPQPPLHSYTAIARAKHHLRAHELLNELRRNINNYDYNHCDAFVELERLGFVDNSALAAAMFLTGKIKIQ